MPSFTEMDMHWGNAGNVTEWRAGHADCGGRCHGGGWSSRTASVGGPL
jgi:hypothetical protein